MFRNLIFELQIIFWFENKFYVQAAVVDVVGTIFCFNS